MHHVSDFTYSKKNNNLDVQFHLTVYFTLLNIGYLFKLYKSITNFGTVNKTNSDSSSLDSISEHDKNVFTIETRTTIIAMIYSRMILNL